LKGIGGLYTVQTEDGLVESRARGIFRHENTQLLPGDRVIIETQPDGAPLITELQERKNSLIRPAVANLDTIVIIASAAPPITETFLIDKVSVIAELKNIDVLICLNKTDLDPAVTLWKIYNQAGFECLRLSAHTGEGIEALQQRLRGRVSALTGNSGVGKSSILHKMYPELEIPVGNLSEKLGRGKHTTRHTELFALPDGGYIADTPGFSAFDVTKLESLLREDIQFGFREMQPYLTDCRYTGCAHIKEDGCAILKAVKRGVVPKSRHESYVQLYELLRDVRHWNLKEK